MFRTRWIHKLFTRQRRRPTAKTHKPVRLRLEPLEERLTPHADPTTCVAGNALINFYGHGHSPAFVIPVTIKDNAGGVCDSGNVTVSLVSGNSTITLGSCAVDSHGHANVKVDLGCLPDNLSVGSYHLVEHYEGNSHFSSCNGSGSLTVSALPTSIAPITLTFSCTNTTSSLTISTHVNCSSATVSGGTVTFELVSGKDTIQLGKATVGANGVATLTVTDEATLKELASLKPGHYELVEIFSGSGPFAGCSTTTTVTVNPTPTTIVVSPTVNVTINNNTTYNITINVNTPSGPATSGSVTLDLVVNGKTIVLGTGTVGPNGTVTVNVNGTILSSLSPGQYQLIVNFNAGSGSTNANSSTTTTLTLLPSVGPSVSTTGTITIIAPGNGISNFNGGPTIIPVVINGPSGPVSGGTVTITLLTPTGSEVIGSGPVSGGAAAVPVTIPPGLLPGTYSLLESYTDSSGTFPGSNAIGTLIVQPLNPLVAALELALDAAMIANMNNPGSVGELQMFSQVFLHQSVPTLLPQLLSNIQSLLPQTGSMLFPALQFAGFLDIDLPIENPM